MRKRKILSVSGALLLAAALSLFVYADMPQEPGELLYINDFAGVLDEDAAWSMADDGAALFESGGPRLVLTTVDFTDGKPIADYALELYNLWGIEDDGLLVLLAIGDADYTAIQGTQLEQTVPAGDLQIILDEYLEADFDSGAYTAGAQAVYGALVEYCGGAVGQDAVSGDYVADLAGVLSAGAIASIDRLGASSLEETGGAVYVVALQDLEGDDIVDRTIAIFEDNRLTGSDALFVMSVGDDAYYTTWGEYVEIPDTTINSIIDNGIEPAFDRGDYDGAAQAAAEGLSRALRDAYAALPDPTQEVAPQTVPQQGQYYTDTRSSGSAGWGFLVLVLIVALVVSLATSNTRRRYYRSYYGVPFNPFAPRYVRRYGPGGYWGHYGGPVAGYYSSPMPYMPMWRRPRGYRPPPPPPGGGVGGANRPPAGGSSRPSSGASGRPSGGGVNPNAGKGRPTQGGLFGGGSASSKPSSSGGMFGGSSSSSKPSSSTKPSSSGGFGGGSSRGAGAGRSSSSAGRSGSLGSSGFGGGSRSSSSGSSRSSGSGFGGGSRSSGGSFGGGASRGGGAGRGRK